MTAYAPVDKQLYEAALPMVKENEYVGDIEIKILYDDKHIINYRLIPYNKETDSLADKQNIHWQVLQ